LKQVFVSSRKVRAIKMLGVRPLSPLGRHFRLPARNRLPPLALFGGGLIGDSVIRVKVVNLTTGATVLNQTATLTFANPSKTFSWNVSGNSPTGYRMTVTNLSNKNKPLLNYEIK
jgi:hypothetical protein